MNDEQHREEYLARAKEAEQQAAHAIEPDIKESLLKIAAVYREMAKGKAS
jgi:hypothetical protein